jgi:acyl-CoA thioesterase FadM
MGGIISKWLVLHEYPVTGTVGDDVVERWVDAARQAYLDQCPVLHETVRAAGLVVRHRTGAVPPGAALGHPAEVVVTATASEVRPSSFTISVRLRPIGGDRELPVSASCVVRLEDEATGEARELGTAVRDELIALEHSARHYN